MCVDICVDMRWRSAAHRWKGIAEPVVVRTGHAYTPRHGPAVSDADMEPMWEAVWLQILGPDPVFFLGVGA